MKLRQTNRFEVESALAFAPPKSQMLRARSRRTGLKFVCLRPVSRAREASICLQAARLTGVSTQPFEKALKRSLLLDGPDRSGQPAISPLAFNTPISNWRIQYWRVKGQKIHAAVSGGAGAAPALNLAARRSGAAAFADSTAPPPKARELHSARARARLKLSPLTGPVNRAL